MREVLTVFFRNAVLVFTTFMLMVGAAGAQSGDVASDVQRRLHRSKSHALLVGVSRYERNPLPWVEEEVRRVTKALDDADFTIHVPSDFLPVSGGQGTLTVRELRAALVTFRERYGDDPDNRLIVYFASHGEATSPTDPDGGGGGYLILTGDSERPNESTRFSVNDLRYILDPNHIKARHLFVFVNACFGAAMAPVLNVRSAEAFAAPDDKTDPVSVNLRNKLDARAWLFMSAGTDSQAVPDDKSPFAFAVSRGLSGEADLDGDGYVLGMELAVFVRKTVGEEMARTGRRNDPIFAWLNSGGEAGDFVFRSPARMAAPKPQIVSREEEVTRRRNERLGDMRSFTECADCPVMMEMVGPAGPIGLARTEITYLEWDACFRELGCARYIDDGGLGRGTRAVGGLSWEDAKQYVEWLDGKRGEASLCQRYRVPMKAEWKAAATGGAQSRFTWGDDEAQDRASCWGCGEGQDGRAAMEVASFMPNVNGFFDMTGNLWEWVDEPVGQCDFTNLALGNSQCEPGTVMGGSYATRLGQLNTLQEAKLPRTKAPGTVGASGAFALPTVGLRVACVLKQTQ